MELSIVREKLLALDKVDFVPTRRSSDFSLFKEIRTVKMNPKCLENIAEWEEVDNEGGDRIMILLELGL